MLALLAAAIAHAGCGDDPAPVLSTVPPALMTIEGLAEDTYDQAMAGNADAVAINADDIDLRWQEFRAQATRDGATTAVLSSMDDAVAGLHAVVDANGDTTALARAANSVSAPMPRLFELYEDPVPPAVLQLDYLGREVVLDAREGNYNGATTHVDAIESAFGSVRNALIDDGGDQQATAYDANVTALRTDIAAADATALEADANVGLELVDDMEGVFTSAAESAASGEQPD